MLQVLYYVVGCIPLQCVFAAAGVFFAAWGIGHSEGLSLHGRCHRMSGYVQYRALGAVCGVGSKGPRESIFEGYTARSGRVALQKFDCIAFEL